MMQNNEKNKKNNETPSLLSYVAVKEQLMMQASSLLDDRTIESMLEEEKVKFDNAARLGLSPSVFIGMNTLRYCKDTIRKYSFGRTKKAAWQICYPSRSRKKAIKKKCNTKRKCFTGNNFFLQAICFFFF